MINQSTLMRKYTKSIFVGFHSILSIISRSHSFYWYRSINNGARFRRFVLIATIPSIQNWLLSSLSNQILNSVTRLRTSHAVWIALKKLFVLKLKARLIPLKIQFQTMKKGLLSISNFFSKMEGIADQTSSHRASMLETW